MDRSLISFNFTTKIFGGILFFFFFVFFVFCYFWSKVTLSKNRYYTLIFFLQYQCLKCLNKVTPVRILNMNSLHHPQKWTIFHKVPQNYTKLTQTYTKLQKTYTKLTQNLHKTYTKLHKPHTKLHKSPRNLDKLTKN